MIYLMRHGQDDETYIGGWSDVSLIESGKEEVLETALWMKQNLAIKKIDVSDVKRAIESAEIVSDTLGIPYTLNSNLREQSKGILNGKPKEETYQLYPQYKEENVTVDTVYPEGESLRILYERIKIYLEKIMEMEDDTLLITHRGVINMIYFLLNNKELDMNKKQFNVTTASLHELDKEARTIKKVR